METMGCREVDRVTFGDAVNAGSAPGSSPRRLAQGGLQEVTTAARQPCRADFWASVNFSVLYFPFPESTSIRTRKRAVVDEMKAMTK
jgi:hypothetical protein